MREPVVFRSLAFPIPVFDRLKQLQRRWEADTGERFTLNRTIAAIVREHQLNEEREAHDQASKQPAILRNPRA